jgi:hypothetical protein
MGNKSSRIEFAVLTKSNLAKRAALQCSICKAVTMGPNSKSRNSITNIGVAAHICGASPGGPRYDPKMSPAQRSDIANGIWLCQNHAKLIDCDDVTWTKNALLRTKHEHEQYISSILGKSQVSVSDRSQKKSSTLVEYGFLHVGEIGLEAYKKLIEPILVDKGLNDKSELGFLMFHSPDRTVLVNAGWLRWRLTAHSQGYAVPGEAPPQLIYGQIPAFPDTVLEFLAAIVMTGSTFVWHRHPGGYLVLAPPPRT